LVRRGPFFAPLFGVGLTFCPSRFKNAGSGTILALVFIFLFSGRFGAFPELAGLCFPAKLKNLGKKTKKQLAFKGGRLELDNFPRRRCSAHGGRVGGMTFY